MCGKLYLVGTSYLDLAVGIYKVPTWHLNQLAAGKAGEVGAYHHKAVCAPRVAVGKQSFLCSVLALAKTYRAGVQR